jgi:hypothetical protein
MSKQNTPETPNDRNGSNPAEKPKATGFGEFADEYRARWVSTHPKAHQPWRDDDEPASQSPAATNADGTDVVIEPKAPEKR